MNKECSVCCDTIIVVDKEEVLLTCLHSICSKCLNDFKDIPQNEHTCKLCEEPFDLSSLNIMTSTISNCSSHPTKEVVAFCDNCSILVCDNCVTETHATHTLLTFDQATIKNKTLLEQAVTKLSKCTPDIDKALQELFALKIKLKQKQTSIEIEIDTTFNAIIADNTQLASRLETRCDTLKAEVNDKIKANIKITELQEQSLQVVKEHIQLVEQHSKTTPPTDNIFNLLRLTTRTATLQANKIELKPLASDSIRFLFTQPKDFNSCNIEKIGYISHSVFDRDWTSISQPSLVFGTDGFENGQFVCPIGIVQLKDGNTVVSECSNQHLRVFTPQGQFVRGMPFDHELYQMTVSSNDELWIASRDANKVLCVSLQGTILRQIKVNQARSVAISSSGQLFISCDDQNVRSFSSSGALLWTSTGNGFRHPRGIVVHGEEVIVCDYDNNRLQVLSATDGHFIRLLGVSQLHHPTSVAFIPGTDMMIVAQTSRATILKMDGSVVHQWGSSGSQPGQFNLSSYGSVAILQDGRIAFADCNNHRVQIF